MALKKNQISLWEIPHATLTKCEPSQASSLETIVQQKDQNQFLIDLWLFKTPRPQVILTKGTTDSETAENLSHQAPFGHSKSADHYTFVQ